jgi:hypothetical protein
MKSLEAKLAKCVGAAICRMNELSTVDAVGPFICNFR